jgi:hypothetical protein
MYMISCVACVVCRASAAAPRRASQAVPGGLAVVCGVGGPALSLLQAVLRLAADLAAELGDAEGLQVSAVPLMDADWASTVHLYLFEVRVRVAAGRGRRARASARAPCSWQCGAGLEHCTCEVAACLAAAAAAQACATEVPPLPLPPRCRRWSSCGARRSRQGSSRCRRRRRSRCLGGCGR